MTDSTARQPVRERVARHRRGVARKLDDVLDDLAALRSEVRAAINLCAEQRDDEQREQDQQQQHQSEQR